MKPISLETKIYQETMFALKTKASDFQGCVQHVNWKELLDIHATVLALVVRQILAWSVANSLVETTLNTFWFPKSDSGSLIHLFGYSSETPPKDAVTTALMCNTGYRKSGDDL